MVVYYTQDAEESFGEDEEPLILWENGKRYMFINGRKVYLGYVWLRDAPQGATA